MSARHLPTMPVTAPAAYLKEHIGIPAAGWQVPPAEMQDRLRPLIYVYDLPAEYNSRMLQYR